MSKHELYVDKQELRKELRKYKQTSEMSDELGVMFLKIAKRFSSKPCFSGYSYKDDFVNDAVFRMVEQVHRINAEANAFSYLTQICYNCFIGKIVKEKKYTKMKNELVEILVEDMESVEGVTFKKTHKDLHGHEESHHDDQPHEMIIRH